jgi:hypothetical protein
MCMIREPSPGCTEHPIIGAWLDIEEAVPVVEAPGISVDFVDVDVDFRAAVLA